ncbi:MAG: TonB-dependent receptor [Caulobacteraceae bacterium]
MDKTKRTLLLATSLASVMGGGVACAADAASSDASQPTTVEQIVVTAEKRAENVQSVPLTVTPFTGATIEKMHVETLRDLTGSVPNVQILENGGLALVSQFTIRGIGEFNVPLPYVGTEVVTTIDGVVQGSNLFGLTNRFDLERIEVLAGPQGTLFGANTTAGVVNIVTRQPTGEFGAYGTITVGNYHRFNVEAAVNFPIIPGVLAGKVAVDHEGRDGFYKNLYDGTRIDNIDDNILRGYLKWTPGPDLDVTLKAEYEHLKAGNTLLNTSLTYPGEFFYRPGTPRGFELYDLYGSTPNTNIFKAFTLTANWASPYGHVTSITSYEDYKYTQFLDFSGIKCYCFIGFPGRDGWSDHGWQLSQELRDVVHPLKNVELLVGAFALTWEDAPDGFTVPGFVNPDIIAEGITHERTTNVSGFAQVYWDITDRLRFDGGLRVSWDKAYLFRANYTYFQPAGTQALLSFNNLIGATFLGSTPGNEPSSGEHSWTNEGGRIGLDYKITPDAMVYGFYARGFKSGGFNGAVTRKQNIGPYNPEQVNSFEAGVKSEWFDRRLLLNAAIFLNKWNNMQVEQFTFADPTTLNSVILNAGKATTKGVEFTAEVVPIRGLRLSGNLGYLSAHFDRFFSSTGPLCPPPPQPQPLGCAINYAGRDIPYSPHWTGSLHASYTVAVAGGDLDAAVEWTYSDPKWGNYTEASVERLPAVRLFNANVSWGPKDGHWTVALWGRNLANKHYTANALDVPPLFTESVLGSPREIGADFKFNF